MTDKPLFGWLTSLYPLWAALDTESVYVSTWVGLAELALSGCTTSTDHLYLHPHGAGDLLTAEIEAARDIGDALPSHARLDVALAEGRRAAARPRRRATTTRSSPPARRRCTATTTVRGGR